VHEGATQSSLAHILSRPTMYGLMLSQACIVYNSYLFLTWLPTYLQTTLHLSTMNTGLFTAIPYGLSIILGLLIAWLSDRVLSPTAVRSGGRRYFVVAMMIMGMTVLAAPMAHDAVTLLVVMTVVLTATNTASGFNLTMVNDVAENPRDAARIMSLAVFGGNICGLLAPIVTGYVVSATGGFDWAFRIAAFLLVIGALVSILLSRGRVTAEHPHIAIGATAGATAG
jgi:ACS family glucarate transporter-like MFS transporter